MQARDTNREEFLKRARSLHGNKYCYDRVEYVNARTPVEVICLKHGSWMVVPYAHAPPNRMRGTGCPRCAGHHRTKADLVVEASAIHGAKYDYTKTIFRGSAKHFEVYCPKHNKTWSTTWHSHITQAHGCQQCGAERDFDLDAFIQRASQLHKNRYDYSQVMEWGGWHSPIPLGCRTHGIFWQRPTVHIYLQGGCPRCAAQVRGIEARDNTADFIRKSRAVHGDKYDYSRTEYVSDSEEVKIFCRQHGEFTQRADHHKRGAGCSMCHFEAMEQERSYTFDDFLKLAEDTHLGRYEYDASSWTGYLEKLNIKCPSHGWFMQSAAGHARGSGCPSCQESRGERDIARYLETLGITYERQKKFSTCIDRRSLPFDFYVPDLNLLIEYDGEQHYMDSGRGIFTNDDIVSIKRRDRIKTEFCAASGINLIRIRYDQSVQEELAFLKERI